MFVKLWNYFIKFVVYDKRQEGRYVVYRTTFTRTALLITLLIAANILATNPARIEIELIIGAPIMLGIFARALDHSRAISRKIVRKTWNEVDWYYEVPQA